MGKSGFTKNEFIELSTKKHGKKYDYSKTVYKTMLDDVNIICPKHGKFTIRASSHINGFGCKKCKAENSFIKRANKIYKNKYDYSKICYNRMVDAIEIICPKHGGFWNTPNHHLLGGGCKKCISKKQI